jgi:hypothetical protein
VPFPEIVKPDRTSLIVHWMRSRLKTHGRCLVGTGVSRALRICIDADEQGLDLSGVIMSTAGEPLTAAKAAAMRRREVRCIPNYAMVEAGLIAAGCAQPAAFDDMHLFQDAFALIVHPCALDDFPVTVPALNFTSLLAAAPKILLNVQSDDYGIVEERSCGCELETYGYTIHLREVRSYGKLVGEGVTLIGDEMLAILEGVLPARFGGSSLDYQLMEEEDEQGFTRLFIVVSPSVDIPDERQVINVVLQALRDSSPMADAAGTTWRYTQTLQVKRMEPIQTARGKLLPLHLSHTGRRQ